MGLGAPAHSSSAPTHVPPPATPENLSSSVFKRKILSGDGVVMEHKAEPLLIKALPVLVI